MFYSYSWSVSDPYLSCYCLAQDSTPKIIHYSGYKPPLYITYDGLDDEGGCADLINYLRACLSPSGHEPTSWDMVQMSSSIDIRQKITHLVVRFPTWDARRHCSNLLIKAPRCIGGRMVDVKISNIEIDDVTVFLADKDIDYTGWVKPINLTSSYYCTDLVRCNGDTVINPLILSFDIECYSSRNSRMPRSYSMSDKIIMICAVTKRYNVGETETICFLLKDVAREGFTYGVHTIICSDELDLIRSFLRYIVDKDPVIISGYNIYGFDIPYIINRMYLQLEDLGVNISRDSGATIIKDVDFKNSAYGYFRGVMMSCSGRISMDLLAIFKRNDKLKVRSLSEVSRIFLDEDKEDMSPKQMFAIFEDPRNEPLNRVISYCAKDALLVLMLIEKLEMWATWTEESAATSVPMEDLYIRGSTVRASNLFYRECIKRRVAIRRHSQDRYETIGGYVFEPLLGFHKNCTCVDFKSLYPSIIIEHNICTSTYEGYRDGRHTFFKEPRGILPAILVGLIEKRAQINEQLRNTKDPEKKSILNARQMSLKLSANGIYGILSTPYDHTLCFSPAAEAVTTLGRKYVAMLREMLERSYGLTCVYGDTDSCYVSESSMTKEEIIEATKRALEEINSILPKNIKISFERYVDTIFIISKKRYVLVVDKQMIHKGNISVRKDNCEFVRRLYSDTLDLVLIKAYSKGQVREFIVSKYRELVSGKVPISDLVITCPVKGQYRNTSDRHNIMVNRLRRSGMNISVNDRVEYLYVKTRGQTRLQGDKMYTREEVEGGDLPIDYAYYIRIKVHPMMRMLLDSLGWERSLVAPDDAF